MKLFLLSLQVKLQLLVEFLYNALVYYGNRNYRRADLALLARYIGKNPYTISKKYALSHGAKDLYTYGETPLPLLPKIVKECEISCDDWLFELGCGRGRACLWLRHIVGCRVTGVEMIAEFVERARPAEDERLHFVQGDFLEANLSNATIIYLYGTSLEEPLLVNLAEKIGALKKGTMVISISFPLSDYALPGHFTPLKTFPVTLHWGKTSAFVEIVGSKP